ncbi:hypothetical protein CP993_25485 [Escherichia coli]|nr:hypothetical protein CP993_25485 [Escherichia coli]
MLHQQDDGSLQIDPDLGVERHGPGRSLEQVQVEEHLNCLRTPKPRNIEVSASSAWVLCSTSRTTDRSRLIRILGSSAMAPDAP